MTSGQIATTIDAVDRCRLDREPKLTELIQKAHQWRLGSSTKDSWRVYLICRFMQVFAWLAQVIEANCITSKDGSCPWTAVFNEEECACIELWMYLSSTSKFEYLEELACSSSWVYISSPTSKFHYLGGEYTFPCMRAFLECKENRKKYLCELVTLGTMFRTMSEDNILCPSDTDDE
jgi:hypothetical protein